MKKTKTKYIKALAILLSMAMLMTGLPAPISAEEVPTPADTLNALEMPVEGTAEQSVETSPEGPEQDEEELLVPGEPEQPFEVPDEETAEPVESPVELPAEQPPEDEPVEEPSMEEHPVKAAINACGYTYLMTDRSAQAFSAADMLEHCFTIEPGGVLLVTAFIEQDVLNMLEVQFLTPAGDLLLAYMYADDLPETLLTGADIEAAALTTSFSQVFAGDSKVAVFAVKGTAPGAAVEDTPVVDIPDKPEQPDIPSEGTSAESETPIEQPEGSEQPPTDELIPEDIPPVEDEPEEELPSEDFTPASEGSFVLVTTDTRAFLDVDESAAEDHEGDLNLGVFVYDAAVQVESIEQDSLGRYWYRVSYMYGDTHADGTLKWTDYDSIYVLAEETWETDAQAFDVTDFAFPYAPVTMSTFSLRASPMYGFSLRNSSMYMGSFYVGQSNLYGDSGKDSEYLQIATLPGHGKIYATPHYLEGYTVYCLEHLLPGPGERISGGGYQPRGPYTVVDLASYMNTPGYSGIMYQTSTMHAIGWVLRHTVPFMELDESYSDNRTWSRVAGQFAIREVIKQLEGPQYVRDYWDMDDFYAASNNAPAVYLEYARWLAENGIARARMTGDIHMSNKSVTTSGGMTIGTVTLTTDADLIRISKSHGMVTGHTYGEDGSYYYLNSGDTITISSSASSFSLKAESMSSPDEEAGFVVGVSHEPIQKLLIPIQGLPNPLKSVTVSFDIPYGAVSVTKMDAGTGNVLAGATFDLISGSTVIQSMTTGADGVVTFTNVPPGTYSIRERTAPEGYTLSSVNVQTVNVSSAQTSRVTFANEKITARIRIIKKDSLTGDTLTGAAFKITRLSGPAVISGMAVDESITIMTDVNGVIETGWLEWGRYRIEETSAPEGFVLTGYSTEVNAYENGKTYTFEVENEPAKGWLRLTKTDRENSNPIAGVMFDVYYADQYGQGLATTMVTDENGVALSEPLRKGQYTVQERGATKGYVFEQVILEATVHSDETTELTATNQPVLVQLRLYKRDSDEYAGDSAVAPGTRGDGVLTGAEFQVLAAEDITDRQGNVIHAKGDVAITSIKTAGADASVTTDKLWPGLYQVVELTPPSGYQPSVQPIIVDARDAAKQSEEAIVIYEGVITNEIKYGAQAIVKLLGDGTAAADPTRVETPEPGAEFRVYLQKAGSYDNARDIERDYLVTDANGYAMTKALPYGVYVLEQVKGKEGYEIKGPITFEIDGTESLVNPPPLTLSDQPILYRLKFIKTDSVTGKTITLSNASFKLKDADGNYVKQKVFYPREQVIDTFTTDDTGSVTLPETVTWGLYFIEEAKAPEGYLIRTDPLSVFVGHEGDLPGQTYELEIEIPNDPVMGRILLDKRGLQMVDVEIITDAWGNEVHMPVYEEDYLAGAVFEIRAAENITGKDGTVWFQADELVDTITTTANGGDASKELPLGKYHVIEVSAPEGYLFTDRAHVVDLKYKDDQTALVDASLTVGNDFLPTELSLYKEKETISIVSSGKDGVKSVLTDEAGEGFVFGLFTAHDMPYAYGTLMADTLVASGATDKNGMLTLNGTFPHGDYYIRELHAPAGWKITADRFDLSITPDQKADDENVLRVLLTDAIHNELIHTKVTLTKTDITGEKTLPGAVIEVYNEDGQIIYRDTTDETGRIANIPVTPGRYTFREVYAPDGYSLNDVTMSFAVSEEGVVTGDTTIRDDYTRFSVEKLDDAKNPLAGVEFSLVDSNGVAIISARTDHNGIATFEKVPFGTYRIVETKPLAGYLPAETDVEVTVDGTFINPEQPIATLINIPNEIVIRKVDQDGSPLVGAEFGLFDAFGERFAMAASDENGMVRFTKVPYGSYTIRELFAPDGYLASREEIAVTIDADYRSSDQPIATVKNHFKRVQFIKVDTSGKYLPGVEFSLINAVTHEVVETTVSNDKGEFIFTKFDYGDWIIRETEAPEGYNRMEDYLLHVDESWTEPEPITLVNIPSTYMFFKSDNRKNALAGVTFVVEDENGHVVQEAVSAENGVVTIRGLTPGKYTIREIATVEGFTVNDDTIEVVIDEKYEVPTKLKRFVNYPSISTGVDVSPTTLTWIGLGLAGIAGVIVIVSMKKKPVPRYARKRK